LYEELIEFDGGVSHADDEEFIELDGGVSHADDEGR